MHILNKIWNVNNKYLKKRETERDRESFWEVLRHMGLDPWWLESIWKGFRERKPSQLWVELLN